MDYIQDHMRHYAPYDTIHYVIHTKLQHTLTYYILDGAVPPSSWWWRATGVVGGTLPMPFPPLTLLLLPPLPFLPLTPLPACALSNVKQV